MNTRFNTFLSGLAIAAIAAFLLVFATRSHGQGTPPAPMEPTVQIPFTLEMQPGTTIDFADLTQREVGPLRGYVYIRIQGELVVMPVYRPTPDGTLWRVAPVPGCEQR